MQRIHQRPGLLRGLALVGLFVLIALRSATIVMPIDQVQASIAHTAWEHLIQQGNYRWEATLTQTLLPRSVPHMVGASKEQFVFAADGIVQLPDRATLHIRGNDSTAETITLVRDGAW